METQVQSQILISHEPLDAKSMSCSPKQSQESVERVRAANTSSLVHADPQSSSDEDSAPQSEVAGPRRLSKRKRSFKGRRTPTRANRADIEEARQLELKINKNRQRAADDNNERRQVKKKRK